MNYREPAPRKCAYYLCAKRVNPDVEFCSWGHEQAAALREALIALRDARARATQQQRLVGTDLS